MCAAVWRVNRTHLPIALRLTHQTLVQNMLRKGLKYQSGELSGHMLHLKSFYLFMH